MLGLKRSRYKLGRETPLKVYGYFHSVETNIVNFFASNFYSDFHSDTFFLHCSEENISLIVRKLNSPTPQ